MTGCENGGKIQIYIVHGVKGNTISVFLDFLTVKMIILYGKTTIGWILFCRSVSPIGHAKWNHAHVDTAHRDFLCPPTPPQLLARENFAPKNKQK